MNTLSLEYEQDFQGWINQHIVLLKTGKVNELDVEHLIEELEDMGKSNIRELESRLVILIAHLLKWQFQATQQSGSWRGSIIEQRIQILRLLRKIPSLKRELPNAVSDAYADALKLAIKETKLPSTAFPTECPYSIEQLLDEDFYPGSE
ncbi:MAG: hypothetical protein BWK78_02900 [Thiotrichaceae bacterium IS1]|nr:MAG: hypothetical protein BWK78_02900 [Thiotrichaceae bacterium IS1]